MMLDSIIISAVGTIMTALFAVGVARVSRYMREREKREIKKESQLELHYIKLDAILYTLGTVGDHKELFERTYLKRYNQMLAERKDLEQLINQNS